MTLIGQFEHNSRPRNGSSQITCSEVTTQRSKVRFRSAIPGVRHSGGPPFRGITVIITLTLTLTLTPRSPEWRTYGMAGRYRKYDHRPCTLVRCCAFSGCVSQNALNFVWSFSIPLPEQDSACIPGRRPIMASRLRLTKALSRKLIVRRSRLATTGNRAFSITTHYWWDDLTVDDVSALYVLVFKKHLKHMFNGSLRRSRSFKVTDFGTNRKPIYDFQLVINTNLPPILHRFHVMADYMSNFRNNRGRFTLTHPLGVILCEYPNKLYLHCPTRC